MFLQKIYQLNESKKYQKVCVFRKRLLFSVMLLGLMAFACGCKESSDRPASPSGSNPAGVSDISESTDNAYDASSFAAASDASTEEQPSLPDENGRPVINFYHSYRADRQDRDLCSSFVSAWTAKKDIVILEPLAYDQPTHVGSISSYATFWRELWEAFPCAGQCKLGYCMDITLSDGNTVHKVITKPSDTDSFYNYVEMYLYDDVHQKPNTWYSHLLDTQVTDRTLMTSIKLTAGSQIHLVKTISVSVFVYAGPEDFNEKGDFTGTHISTAVLTQP